MTQKRDRALMIKPETMLASSCSKGMCISLAKRAMRAKRRPRRISTIFAWDSLLMTRFNKSSPTATAVSNESKPFHHRSLPQKKVLGVKTYDLIAISDTNIVEKIASTTTHPTESDARSRENPSSTKLVTMAALERAVTKFTNHLCLFSGLGFSASSTCTALEAGIASPRRVFWMTNVFNAHALETRLGKSSSKTISRKAVQDITGCTAWEIEALRPLLKTFPWIRRNSLSASSSSSIESMFSGFHIFLRPACMAKYRSAGITTFDETSVTLKSSSSLMDKGTPSVEE
mmetsp:Transcript_136019/g.322310  ORF Transcript_136019/g.322310 Transcript_136019/m.322310 type:complete len:288 (+) Transcript_136019:984-1847(+)